jgi:hypothetical protein
MESMKKIITVVLIIIMLLILFWGTIIPAAAEEDPFNPVIEPVTEDLTEMPTVLPPTEEPTEMPTVRPPTEEPTEMPTVLPPTEEPTITIWTTAPKIGGGKGYIDTYCNVDGASVSFDDRYQCTIAQGVCTVGVSPTGTPINTVTVSKAGYDTWSGHLSGMPADQEHVEVYATLNPVPTQTTIPPVQKGAIYAQSNPAGAAIYMNGNLQGYSPVTIPNLPPGTYSMKASLSGYTPDTQLINVYSGQTATYYPNLQQSPPAPRSTGTVSVSSTPNAALVYVDGNYQGKTPLTVTLYPGNHNFRLSLTGYNDYTASVYVTANTNQRLDASFNSAVFGTVSVSSMPGATVWLDSNNQGNIPSSGTLTLFNIASGNHLFKVTASGYNNWMNTIYVQPNAVTPISAVLNPSGGVPTPVTPVPPATGGFNIVSTPSGAEILIDNLFRGYTPATPDGIAAGQHQVLLKYTGYIDYSTTANVNAGQITPLAISMQAAPTPTHESAPSPVLLVGGLIVILGIGVSLRRRS